MQAAMHQDDNLRNKLISYIQDAYAMENHIVGILEKQVKATQRFPDIQAQIQQHLEATKQHRQRMEDRLGFYNTKPSAVKEAVTNVMGNVAGAVAGARTDSLAKDARDDYATEHLEIAAYELLIATAQAFGDRDTIQACEMNLRDEVVMAHWLESHMGRTALLSLREDGIAVDESALSSADLAVNSAQQTAQRAQHERPNVDVARQGAVGIPSNPLTR
jgi:ferritin-like metal-binding protein YciE